MYYDDQDPECKGWAYRCDVHGRTGGASGGLDGFETELTLTRAEARKLAVLALAEDTEALRVQVYWHGEAEAPLTFAREELQVAEGEAQS